MKRNVNKLGQILLGCSLLLMVWAMQAKGQKPTASPSPSPNKSSAQSAASPSEPGEDSGDYTIISSIEVGVRGMRVVGDTNKYKSDLNYNAGVRLFDTSFLMRSKDNKGHPFDTLLVSSTGWGADPYGQMRINVEKPKWYRFEGSYRRFKYFRFLNNFANPNFVFSPANFSVPPNPLTGEHGLNTTTQLGDFDLTILPKNRTIRFNVGYSPERYSGPAYTTYHLGGNEFLLLSELRSRANDFRFGADGKVGPIDFSFLQGFRRFRDDSFINLGPTPGVNLNPAVARFTSFTRNEPTRGRVNYTRFSAHTLVAQKLDMTGRIVYSSATSDFTFIESFAGVNFNTRITGALNPPNILTLGGYNIPGDTKRPNTLADFGVTYLATDKLRISNTFRVETFQINGGDRYRAAFLLTTTAGVPRPIIADNGGAGFGVYKVTKYRKIQDTVEGDYQFTPHYSMHLGYRYANRRDEQILSGFALNANLPTLLVPEDDVEHNHTHAVLGGFRARPIENWTIYFDAEHGTADNVFTRIGNYNYTNVRAKTRYAPSHNLTFNLGVIARNNSNPSEIAGVSLTDFGVSIKSRTFTSAVDWVATPKVSLSAGYNYSWVNSDAIVDYFFNSVRHPSGHSQYFMRNNFFYVDATAQLLPRLTLYASYRVNQDNGQGSRLADPTGSPGILISSYPMSFQSPEARLAFKINRRLDWNIGYQYYNYNENQIVGPRPQNYHAHLPYTSLRIYIGRRE